MNVLCINQFFWPDLAPTSQLLTDLTRNLAQDGHNITVICGTAVYSRSDNSGLPRGVNVIRVPSLPFSRGLVSRVLGYVLFFLLALWHTLRARKPDIVLTMTTPPLASVIGTIGKKLHGAQHFIWEMDLYPEIAVDLGLLSPKSLLARFIGYCADAQRRQADGIIALGECMKKRLVSRGLNEFKIHVADNWANGDIFCPRRAIPGARLSLIYPGNLGLGHDQHTLMDALPALETDGRFSVTFVGGGPRYNTLKSWCEAHHCSTVKFKPYCTALELASEEIPKSNIGLVLQDARCSGSIVPSKVYPLLASGLPVLFIGPSTATPARIIERFQCGWHIEVGASMDLVALLNRLAENSAEVSSFGERARRAFLEHFDQPLGVARVSEILGVKTKAAASTAYSKP